MKRSAIVFSIFAVFLGFQPGPAGAEEQRGAESPLEQNKQEIIERVETVEQDMKVAKGCVSEAKTPEELEKCYENDKVRKFQEVQQSLDEMGMTWEERRINRLEPRK